MDTPEAAFRQALSVLQDLGDLVHAAAALNNLGLIYRVRGERGQLDEALACYQAAATICERIGDTYGLAAARLNCALIHAYRGDWQAGWQDGGRAWQLA